MSKSPRWLFTQPAFYVFTQDDGLGHFLHRLPPLPALPLNREISLFLGHFEFALEYPFRALDQLARFQFLGEMQIFAFQPGHLDFRADQKSDGRYQIDFTLRILVRVTIL